MDGLGGGVVGGAGFMGRVGVVVVEVVAFLVVLLGAGGFSLEVWDRVGRGEGEGDVKSSVVGASRECPGRETVRPGLGLLDSVVDTWRATHRATAV